MKSLLTLIAVFTGGTVGLYELDRRGMLPEVYTGPPAAKAAEKPPPWYAMGDPMLVTLRDGTTVRVTVALQLPKPYPKFDGQGVLAQEAVIRSLVTDTLMARRWDELASSRGRARVGRLLKRRIRAHTDVRPRRVLLPDLIAG